MSDIQCVDLKSKINTKGGISPLRAEWRAQRSKLVLIKYATSRGEEELGVRLDMDKKAFLDHVTPEVDKILEGMLPDIWMAIVQYKHQVSA